MAAMCGGIVGVACDAKASVLLDVADVAVADGGTIALINGANDVGGAQPEYTLLPGSECVDDGTAWATPTFTV
jgi:hypothetical protein